MDTDDSLRVLEGERGKECRDILADIVGHPHGMPSIEELVHMNPPLDEDTIRSHLDRLEESGIIEANDLPPANRQEGFPHRFYSVTAHSRELFDREGRFPVEAWQRQYGSVEKTLRIREVEAIPRPEI